MIRRKPHNLINLSPGYAFRYGRGGGQLGKRSAVALAADFTKMAVGTIDAAGTVWKSDNGRGSGANVVDVYDTGLAAPNPSRALKFDPASAQGSAYTFPLVGGNQVAAANLLKGWAAEMDFVWRAGGSNFWNVYLAFEAGSAGQGSFQPYGNWVALHLNNGFGEIYAEEVQGGLYFNHFINTAAGANNGVIAYNTVYTLRVEVGPGNGATNRSLRVLLNGIEQYNTAAAMTATPSGSYFGIGVENTGPIPFAFRFTGSR
jgi:hypothetical protein